MWQNILIILIIILFSYIFTFKDKNYFDLQMLFILLSLFSIVIYKLMFLKTLKINENYTNNDNQNDVSTFAGSNNKGSVSDKTGDNKHIISKLQMEMETLKLELENLNKERQSKGKGFKDGSRPIADTVTSQDYEIKKLEKNLENLKEQLFFTNEEQAKQTYKKIKVYNSCKPPKPTTQGIKTSLTQSPEIVNSNTQKQDFFKMLLEKLEQTGFKLNLNLV